MLASEGRTVRCPALLVAAPASGQGKTSVTAALARWHRRQGRRVRVFKVGPDYLDPGVLELASGAPVYQLDGWMGGADHVQALLHRAAQTADLLLIEGVMGLHDGEPSSAALALELQLPVLLVIDGSAMAQTFGALALGLARYRPGLQVAGVLANRVAGETHAGLLRESLPPDLPWWGWWPRSEAWTLPERHLGLVQARELSDLDARLEAAAQALPPEARGLPPSVNWAPPGPQPIDAAPALEGVTVAVARDEAFAFIYPANLDVLHALGARTVFFSPLHDRSLPPCDAVWLPGGYPELHAAQWSGRFAMHGELRAHVNAGKPLLAECGGLMAVLDRLVDVDGRVWPMAGLLGGEARMGRRLVAIGLHEAPLPEGRLRGHSFHYSSAELRLAPLCHTEPQRAGRRGEPVWRQGRLTATYFHAYFPSHPAAIAALLRP